MVPNLPRILSGCRLLHSLDARQISTFSFSFHFINNFFFFVLHGKHAGDFCSILLRFWAGWQISGGTSTQWLIFILSEQEEGLPSIPSMPCMMTYQLIQNVGHFRYTETRRFWFGLQRPLYNQMATGKCWLFPQFWKIVIFRRMWHHGITWRLCSLTLLLPLISSNGRL